MKIIIAIIISITFFISTHGYYELSKKDKLIENRLNFAIQKSLKKENLEFREKLIYNLEIIQNNNIKTYFIIENIKIKNWLHNFNKKQDILYENFKINRNKVEEAWISFHNHERKNLWLKELKINKYLNNTSFEWSENQKSFWEMSHKRLESDNFYNHRSIENWFWNRWIKCSPKWGISVTESIAKYSFYCDKENCTDELIKSIREIFLIYMAEKWLKYPDNAHYRAIIHKNLSEIWLWISINETSTKNLYEYYLTSHYCTEIIN